MSTPTVASLLRVEQAFCSQLCDKETLDFGIAYCCERFPHLAELNQLREVMVEDVARLPEFLRIVDEWFGGRGLICRRWVPAGGAAAVELSRLLLGTGYEHRTIKALRLHQYVPPSAFPDVRILPARAMRSALRSTFLDFASPGGIELAQEAADACEERLNDPQLDMFVALMGGVPVGRCALYQVGDIGRVIGPAVGPMAEAARIAKALLEYVLALAKRLLLRNVVASASENEDEARVLLAAHGMIEDGTVVEFHRDPFDGLRPAA